MATALLCVCTSLDALEESSSGRSMADEKDAAEDGGDSRPLPAGDVFAQKNCGEAHGDGSVERAEDADDGYLLHLHAAIAQNKRESVKRAHAESHPTDAAARKAHGLFREKNDARGQGGTGQANHPNSLNRADARHNADPEQPE